MSETKFEYEERYKETNPLETQRKLAVAKFALSHREMQIDHWFIPKGIMSPNEQGQWFDYEQGYALRIREKASGVKPRVIITSKRLLRPADHSAMTNNEEALTAGSMLNSKEKLIFVPLVRWYTLGRPLEKKMTAYNDLLNNSSVQKLKEYRQSLISEQSRGNLVSGNLPSAIDIMVKAELPDSDEAPKEITKMFIKSGRSSDPGFIFNVQGAERVLKTVEAGGKIKFFDDFLDLYAFSGKDTASLWKEGTDAVKKRCIARNIEDLVKKTEVNYRTHGDRLHYLVVGRIVVKNSGETKNYPLFLFSCTDLNRRTLSAEVESTGFLNFWLDKNLLEDEVSRKIKGFEISIDDTFSSTINDISQLIATLQSSAYDSIEFDPTYTALCVVTGFEPEFIDPAWEKILEN